MLDSAVMEVDLFDEIQRLRQSGRKAALATIVQIRGSVPSFQTAKMLVRDDGSTLGSVGGGCVEAEVWAAAQDVLREEKSRVMSFDLTEDSMAESGLICGGKLEIFIEPILPTPKMVAAANADGTVFARLRPYSPTPLKIALAETYRHPVYSRVVLEF